MSMPAWAEKYRFARGSERQFLSLWTAIGYEVNFMRDEGWSSNLGHSQGPHKISKT